MRDSVSMFGIPSVNIMYTATTDSPKTKAYLAIIC
jgi:hypothetical protein